MAVKIATVSQNTMEKSKDDDTKTKYIYIYNKIFKKKHNLQCGASVPTTPPIQCPVL
jgi:hypothetical protein